MQRAVSVEQGVDEVASLRLTGGGDFLDLESGSEYPNPWIRSTCGIGPLPCNGLYYAGPPSCSCANSVMLNGASAFFLAAQNGHTNVLQLLLSLPGVDPHATVTNASGDQVRAILFSPRAHSSRSSSSSSHTTSLL